MCLDLIDLDPPLWFRRERLHQARIVQIILSIEVDAIMLSLI